MSPDLESMDIHTWCAIPEPELARNSYFYMDDVSLEVIEEPPLAISTPLDEYYVGETIPWTVKAPSTNGTVTIALMMINRLVGERILSAATGPLRGTFETSGLKPGIYTLQARISGLPRQTPPTARRQVVVAPDPFGW